MSLLRAASLIAAVTMASKLLGALRDWLLMDRFGAGLVTDAYFAAFQLPSFVLILLGGLGGPFHTATVAFLSKLGVDAVHQKQQIQVLLTVITAVFLLLTVLLIVFPVPVMSLLLPGASVRLIATAAQQLQLMAPVVLLGGTIGVLYGVLNHHQQFFWPSFSPAMLNVVMIAAMLGCSSATLAQQGPWVLAIATLLGAALQWLVHVPDFWRLGYRFWPRWFSKQSHRLHLAPKQFESFRILLLPAMVGTTIGQLMVYVDMFFTRFLPEGGWSAIMLSNRLIQLPLGVLQTALLVPVFPLFARYVQEDNPQALARVFRQGVVSLWLLTVPMMIAMVFFTRPVIALVFEHGQFDANDTTLVTQALVYQIVSIVPYFARDAITRVFYAHHDSKTPLMVGVLAIALKFLLDAVLVKPFGVGGITLSISIVTLINSGLLAWLSHRRGFRLGFKQLLPAGLKLLLAGGTMWALTALGLEACEAVEGYYPVMARFSPFIAGVLGVFAYGVTILSLGFEEVVWVQARLRARFKK